MQRLKNFAYFTFFSELILLCRVKVMKLFILNPVVECNPVSPKLGSSLVLSSLQPLLGLCSVRELKLSQVTEDTRVI